MNISEKKYETKAMHTVTFQISHSVNRWSVSTVAMTTMTFQNGPKFTFNPIYFANEFGDLQFFKKTKKPWFFLCQKIGSTEIS